MNGENKLLICPAEMNRAMEYYLDSVVFGGQAVETKVSSVAQVDMPGEPFGPYWSISFTTPEPDAQ